MNASQNKTSFKIWLMVALMAAVLNVNAMPVEDIEILNITLFDKQRVDRTAYLYTYQVTLINNGPAIDELKGTVSRQRVWHQSGRFLRDGILPVVSSIGPTTLPDAELVIGNVEFGEIMTPTDTITIQQDSRVPFDPSQLSWSFEGIPGGLNLPPDPGEEGKATLEGIDADGDGLRDDLQRYIMLNFGQVALSAKSLVDLAKAQQDSLTVTDKDESIALANRSNRAFECVIYSVHAEQGLGGDITSENLDEVEKRERDLIVLTFNTEPRLLTYLNYMKQLEGEFFSTASLFPEPLKESCAFDPDAI